MEPRPQSPYSLLESIQWSFDAPRESLEAFTQRCLDMQGDRAGRAKQALSRTVLQASDLEISFELWRPLAAKGAFLPTVLKGMRERIALTRRLSAHSPAGFSGFELLHKAHEAIAGSVGKFPQGSPGSPYASWIAEQSLGEFTWARGFVLESGVGQDPRYVVRLDSSPMSSDELTANDAVAGYF